MRNTLLEEQKKRERDETRKVHYEGSKDCDAWANKKQIVMRCQGERERKRRETEACDCAWKKDDY
jgi:hypothetical protein